eukprot:gene5760-7168_t
MGAILSCSTLSCCGGVSCFGSTVKKSTCTRIIYIVMFLVISILTYVFSYWAYSWFSNLDVFKICTNSSCFGALLVYRMTFGLVLYHLLLGLVLVGVRNSEDSRASIQDGYWPVKLLLLGGIIAGCFFIPNKFYVYYGWISIFAAALFIIVQLILLIEFAYSLNESCVRKIEDEGSTTNKWYVLLIVMSFGSISLALGGSITMIVLFGKGCSLNQFFIVFNMALSLIIGVLSISEKVREYRPSSGLFQSGVVMLYTTYLVYSAIMSEQPSTCSTLINSSPQNHAMVILGAIFTIISVSYSAFRASDSNELLGRGSGGNEFSSIPDIDDGTGGDSKMEDDESHQVAYSYTFFHITFALGAMYICMLLTNWSTINGISNASVNVDSGLVSVWVKIASGWVVHLLYLWTLVGPLLFPNRVWD